ncbi:uncharacterized protein LOC128999491 [Macrosteles quadrilineatus]|uniref:uncharacterized protein LOC128999491 n=1 Tax=Macrosteles quadrilineatus TaxID=74068 RepID=UPI0023E1456C|nr:uncharacterized protein LOC128999491 [Macrosteles quadrilineatus]
MSFGRSKTLLHFDYSLNGLILCRVTVIKDLGLYMTPSLDPGVHITKICAKANSLLGFIARASRNALSPATLKTLYVTLVRPIVEYGSTVWAPHQIGHCDHLNKVQRRFLRLVGVRSGIRYPDVDIQEIANQHHILPLSSRRLALDLIFLFKIVNGYINCPEHLRCIDLHVPAGTRLLQPFSRHSHQTVYAYHSVIPRLLRSGNSAQQLDFFGESLQKFRRQVFSWVAEHGGH